RRRRGAGEIPAPDVTEATEIDAGAAPQAGADLAVEARLGHPAAAALPPESAERPRRRAGGPGARLPGRANDLVHLEHVAVVAERAAVADHHLVAVAVEGALRAAAATPVGRGAHGRCQLAVGVHLAAAGRDA